MQLSRSVVVAIAAAAFWSPFAAAACALDRLMDPPPFAARAVAGNSAAITMPRRGQFRHASDKGEECRHYVFAEAGYECTHRLINSPASSSARRPSASFAFHIGQAWIMCGQTCSVTL